MSEGKDYHCKDMLFSFISAYVDKATGCIDDDKQVDEIEREVLCAIA